MLDRIKGKIVEKEPTRVVISTNNLSFEVYTPLSTSQKIADEGGEVELFIHLTFREKGVTLYGFSTKEEREMFRWITSVPGVGEKTGLNILSQYRPEEIQKCVIEGKIEMLSGIPGIGEKKAAKIIFELKGLLPAKTKEEGVVKDAIKALVSLGLKKSEAESKVKRVKDKEKLPLRTLIKQALHHEEE